MAEAGDSDIGNARQIAKPYIAVLSRAGLI